MHCTHCMSYLEFFDGGLRMSFYSSFHCMQIYLSGAHFAKKTMAYHGSLGIIGMVFVIRS